MSGRWISNNFCNRNLSLQQLDYSEELDFFLGVKNSDAWGLQAAHDNLVSMAEIIESSKSFYEQVINIPSDDDFTKSLSKYIKVIKLPGPWTLSGLDDFVNDLDKYAQRM